MCVCIYKYIYKECACIYIYIYIDIKSECMYVYIYIYIYICMYNNTFTGGVGSNTRSIFYAKFNKFEFRVLLLLD